MKVERACSSGNSITCFYTFRPEIVRKYKLFIENKSEFIVINFDID